MCVVTFSKWNSAPTVIQQLFLTDIDQMPEVDERVMEVISKIGQGELIRDHVIPIMIFDKCREHTGPLPTGKLNFLFLNLLLFHFFHSLFCSAFCNFLFYFFLTKEKEFFNSATHFSRKLLPPHQALLWHWCSVFSLVFLPHVELSRGSC